VSVNDFICVTNAMRKYKGEIMRIRPSAIDGFWLQTFIGTDRTHTLITLKGGHQVMVDESPDEIAAMLDGKFLGKIG
jgi:hypothetical protein